MTPKILKYHETFVLLSISERVVLYKCGKYISTKLKRISDFNETECM